MIHVSFTFYAFMRERERDRQTDRHTEYNTILSLLKAGNSYMLLMIGSFGRMCVGFVPTIGKV